jgi:hypothetical protein
MFDAEVKESELPGPKKRHCEEREREQEHDALATTPLKPEEAKDALPDHAVVEFHDDSL